MKWGNVLNVVGYRRTAEEAEADYARFCSLTKPLQTSGIIIVGLYLTLLILGVFDDLFGSRVGLDTFESAFVFLVFTVVPVVVGTRRREFVPALLCGRLSWAGMAIIGIGAGVGHVLLSILIGLPFLNPLTFDPGWADDGARMRFLALLAGPCAEEVFYQLGLQTVLQRFGPIVAVIGTALPFWATHLWRSEIPFLGTVIYTLLACLIFGVIRQTTKSTGAAIISHSVGNFLLAMVHPAS